MEVTTQAKFQGIPFKEVGGIQHTNYYDGRTDKQMDEQNMSPPEEERHNYTKGKLLEVKYPIYSKINRCIQTMLY